MMRPRRFVSSSPRLNGLSNLVSGHGYSRTGATNDETVPLINLHREASRPLPRRQRARRVRIQGRLAVVQTVSVTKSRQVKNGTSITRTDVHCKYVRVIQKRRKTSYDGGNIEEYDHDDGYTVEDDRQFRGYGIGGAGNIRRPTDIIGTSSRSTTSAMNTKLSKLKLRMSRLLHSLRGYRKSKGSTGSF
ncbi:hypothetical protein F5B22DRAFT_97612 [Xylaria bambusicola]|uniref:uncharacterized protein n=1 Tax=Xylaria bambusicola TaxID=326684 RepID=UPI0020073774|nr:uncharacterized protein F5B22DRAFT_97612 [Xylaria bambusicola]KAI0517753.1 hypothetical protein F5B22DRAFT_97612 [Xylaria bambusicola]